ncbi:MAG: 30S ribosomal protein S20 [Patescibacteria group bacterium]
MAITSSAKKAIRVAKRRRVFNLRRKNTLRNAIKEIKSLINSGKKKEAEMALAKAYKALDKSAKTNLIKKGTASRRKSRLAKAIAKLK